MEVEILYTNINGLTKRIKVGSPEEAMEALNEVPGFAKRPMDEVAEKFIEKMGEKK